MSEASPAYKRIGKTIRQIRTEQGYSLSALSEASGVSKSVLSTLENGKRDVTLRTLENIARHLGFYVWEVLYKSHNDSSR